MKQLLDAGCDLLALKEAGLRVGDFLHAGVAAEVLLDTELFTATELCRAGVPVKQLLDARCDLQTLITVYPLDLLVREWKDRGFTVARFLEQGRPRREQLPIEAFLRAGFTMRDIIQSTSDSSAADLAESLCRAGFYLAGLEHCPAHWLAEAGFSLKFAQSLHCADHMKPIELLCTYNKEELKRLKGLGYMPENLPAVDVSDLRAAGYTAKECRKHAIGTIVVLLDEFGVQALPALMTCLGL